MKHLKTYKIFESDKPSYPNCFKEGDMVYVDAFGPRTLSFSDAGGTVKRDMPFKPKMLDFDNNTKYEIVHLSGRFATIYDDRNIPVDVMTNKLYYEKMDTSYVMECIESSFEDIFDKTRCEYKEYMNELVVNVKDIFLDKDVFDNIFNNEFSKRLLADGFFCNRTFYHVKDGYALGLQMIIIKK